jgi:hypothetical protein
MIMRLDNDNEVDTIMRLLVIQVSSIDNDK